MFAMITAIQQKKGFLWIYLHSGFNSMFAVLTVFGPLFPLFCDALRMSKTRIGFIFSLLPLFYLITIFIYHWVMRQGLKKVLLWFYFIRYWFILALPLAVWVGKHFGDNAAFIWIVVCILFFGIFRSIAETGWSPWVLDLIPARARGKVEALNSMVVNIATILASLAAVFIMKKWEGVFGFTVAMYIGAIFGFISLAMAWRLPGGQPQAVEKRNWTLMADIMESLRNPRYVAWLKAGAFFYIGTACFSFLPLYLSGRIGFTADKIMLFSGCFQAGILTSAFFWGWNADRFGSKPVFMSSLMGLCLIPVCFFLLPRMNQQSLAVTCAVYVFFGVIFQGWQAGSSRYFYVDVLPAGRNPVFCATMASALHNILIASSLFFYGWLLDVLQPIGLDWRFIHLDNFTVIFAIMLICWLCAFYIFRSAPTGSGVRTGDFVSFFFHGNPLLAFTSIVRYHLSEDESWRMELTRRMGDAKSHLTVEELLQAADDPSFNVRYEAIVSMARMPPDDKLVNALSAAVKSREPGLSEAAVWALGRMGDIRAVPILREMLKCEYALLRSQCARSLAKLNDHESASTIIAAFKNERNDNIRSGYAAALGKLRRKEILPELLALLRRLSDEHLRGEVALAIARIAGGEHHFVNLWRRSKSDFETACAEELMEIEKKIAHNSLAAADYREIMAGCAKSFEQRNLPAGVDAVRAMIKSLPSDGIEAPVRDILKECDELIAVHNGARGDYILLALNALRLSVVSLIHQERKKRLLS